MKVVIIDQARMTSTRLPGKVLKPVLGKPLLEYQIERLRRVKRADDVVIATTTNASDDILVDFCRRHGVKVYRGSELDVLSRYYGAAVEAEADVVVRVTSDCPVIDPAVVDQVIGHYLAHQKEYDYVSNTQVRSFPRGMDAEVFSFGALESAYREGQLEYEREHVTPFLYGHPERFRIGQWVFREDRGDDRWTVDTPEDFELIRRIIEDLFPVKPEFTLEDILDLLAMHPDWRQINAHVTQKKLGE
ncbi:MAG: NTP transferase domain-containing protein [Sulfuricellaceae bacterium]|jgi:spore coat polysaccharide biosynthesis protein SpsF